MSMKKYMALILIFGLLLSGCKLISGNTSQTENTQNSVQQDNSSENEQNAETGAKDSEDEPAPSNVAAFEDASVEKLIKLGQDFLNAAFSDNPDKMIDFCDDSFAGKIDSNPGDYIGTKPDYLIDAMKFIIEPQEKNNYILQVEVTALKKDEDTKNKDKFNYLISIEKVKSDYYVVDFKRGRKYASL
jgi:hypothetical protein